MVLYMCRVVVAVAVWRTSPNNAITVSKEQNIFNIYLMLNDSRHGYARYILSVYAAGTCIACTKCTKARQNDCSTQRLHSTNYGPLTMRQNRVKPCICFWSIGISWLATFRSCRHSHHGQCFAFAFHHCLPYAAFFSMSVPFCWCFSDCCILPGRYS